jgi:methylaspartate mutase sigma subunit
MIAKQSEGNVAENPLKRKFKRHSRKGNGPIGRWVKKTVVSSVSSDSHTWNLVFLQKYLQERGHEVTNLGPCVPDEVLVEQCINTDPDLVVISSVNGHGHADGLRVIRKLRDQPELAETPIVIGGKLDINGGQSHRDMKALHDAGFDGVFDDNAGSEDFAEFIESSPHEPPAVSPAVPGENSK